MKKLSSMLALGMALALTFGMTVNAAGSTTTANPDFQPTEAEKEAADSTISSLDSVIENASVTMKDAEGNEVQGDVTVTAVETETMAELLSDTEKVTENAVKALKETGLADLAKNLGVKVDTAKETIEATITKTPVAAAEITIPEGVDTSKGIQLEITLPGLQLEEGATYVIMHLGKDGWEIIVPDEIEDGKVVATFTDLSPVSLHKINIAITPIPNNPTQPDQNTTPNGPVNTGEDQNDDDDGNDSQPAAQAAANPATSPRTAETLPAAGVMALICLAGAAVCAGKIRYNK